MKQQLVLVALIFPFFASSMEMPAACPYTPRNLSADEALELNRQQQALLDKPHTSTTSKTPVLDTYKCAYILGTLKPQGIAKLKRKIPEQLGPLVAQKKHLGKPVSLSEELELWKWQTYLNKKYSRPDSSKDNKA